MLLLKQWHDTLEVKAKEEDFEVSILMTVMWLCIVSYNTRFISENRYIYFIKIIIH